MSIPNERIKNMLTSMKESQKTFANKVGLSTSAVCTILNNKSSVSKLLANSIELKYGVRAEWVLTGVGPMGVSVNSVLIRVEANNGLSAGLNLIEAYIKRIRKERNLTDEV